MGIGVDIIGLLSWLKRDGYLPARPSAMEIGAQQLANSFLRADGAIKELGSLFGVQSEFEVPRPHPTHLAHGSLEHLAENAPSARAFWLWLGFVYASIDIDGSPGSIALDLNHDEIPPSEKRKYHLVTNFGTTEHVANQLNAFEIIHELTAPKGVMVHSVPAQGYFNHGLINYNPKFFWMLARSNGYKMLAQDFVASDVPYRLPENIVDSIQTFRPNTMSRIGGYQAVDASILIVMQKVFDISFVPPIDVPTGARTNIDALKKRYWTIFQENAFDRIKPTD